MLWEMASFWQVLHIRADAGKTRANRALRVSTKINPPQQAIEKHTSTPGKWLRVATCYFEVVEWSEQLRSVTSVLLEAIRRMVRIRLCVSGQKSERMFDIVDVIMPHFVATIVCMSAA